MNTILFDLDGTLLDSRKVLVNAAYKTVQKYKPNFITYSELLDKFGSDYPKLLASMDPVKATEIHQYFIDQKSKQYDKSKLFPYVNEGLNEMKKQGIQLGIVTNQVKDLALLALKVNRIEHLFDVIVTRDDVAEIKPAPEPILLAIDTLHTKLENVCMVGDTDVDLLAAKHAGVKSILIHCHQNKGEQFLPHHYMFTDFKTFFTNINGISKEGIKNG